MIGGTKTVPLKPDGNNIPVTNDNRIGKLLLWLPFFLVLELFYTWKYICESFYTLTPMLA